MQAGRAARTGGPPPPPALEFQGVTKSFPGQLAVDRVSFTVKRGEIHALVGENGAGKSTLIKVLAGNLAADAGEILLDGTPVRVTSPHEAAQLGVGVVHQEPALFDSLSVGENLAIGRGFAASPPGIVRWGREYDAVRPVLRLVGRAIDPRQRLGDLTTHERQLVALARLLLQDCRIVVLDEVTAPLAQAEVERLFEILRGLRDKGVAIIYVSHRLQEIFEIADRVTVMRNGRWIETMAIGELSRHSLTQLIIGAEPASRFEPAVDHSNAALVLRVRDLSDETLRGVSLDLHQGEVVGLAGLAGSGRTNVLESIFGLRRPRSGVVEIDGRYVRSGSPADAVRAGIALVTEDRMHDGFIPRFSVAHNITLPWLASLTRFGLLRLGAEERSAQAAATQFDVRARSIRVPMAELSGGNQQKAILARWLANPIKLLLLDEPTHGVDIGAKARIYGLIHDVAAQGVTVLVVSSELDELEGLCSRVILLAEGRVVGELKGEEIDKGLMLKRVYEAMSEAASVA